MQRRKNTFTSIDMTKDQFFYAYKQLAETEERHLLLESGRGGKMCIAAVNPLATLQALNGGELQIHWRDGTKEVKEGDPLEHLTDFVQSYEVEQIPELPEFQGGLAGFISYDYVRRFEDLPILAKDDLDVPDLYFYLFDEWAVLDIETATAYFITLSESGKNAEEVAKKWKRASAKGVKRKSFEVGVGRDVLMEDKNLKVSITGPRFEEMVREVQHHIAEREVVQVNLTVRQSKPLEANPLMMYEALRSFNPSPYMASIASPSFAVVSGSPELLLKKRGDELSTRPIGGTRPRGTNEKEETAYEADLLSNKKEVSEHKMLIDVEHEDLNRICKPGTVETNELMAVEKYSHVMHLVSNIRGTAADSVSNADIIRGVFPGGSITGMPKHRTMEIIEELEPVRRGLYTGSIGWFGFNGDFELNVVIRTAFIQDGIAHIQAGAGIVADSVPEEEYTESLAKAKALWQAKAMAENEQQ